MTGTHQTPPPKKAKRLRKFVNPHRQRSVAVFTSVLILALKRPTNASARLCKLKTKIRLIPDFFRSILNRHDDQSHIFFCLFILVLMKMAVRRQCQWRNSVAVAMDARRIQNRPTSLCHVKSFICGHWLRHPNDWADVNSFAAHKRTILTMNSARMWHSSYQRMPHSRNSPSNYWNRYVRLEKKLNMHYDWNYWI